MWKIYKICLSAILMRHCCISQRRENKTQQLISHILGGFAHCSVLQRCDKCRPCEWLGCWSKKPCAHSQGPDDSSQDGYQGGSATLQATNFLPCKLHPCSLLLSRSTFAHLSGSLVSLNEEQENLQGCLKCSYPNEPVECYSNK